MDRRSEGSNPKTKVALKQRAEYQLAKSSGICVMCKAKPVSNRSYCYACSDKQSIATALSGARRTLRSVGIDPLSTKDIAKLLSRDKSPFVAKLAKLFKLLNGA